MEGEKQGHYEVFANIPGSCDNLRLSPRNTLLVPVIVTRLPTELCLAEFLANNPALRRLALRFCYFTKMMAHQISSFYPNIYTLDFSYRVGINLAFQRFPSFGLKIN